MVKWDGEWWFYGTTSITEILYFTFEHFEHFAWCSPDQCKNVRGNGILHFGGTSCDLLLCSICYDIYLD